MLLPQVKRWMHHSHIIVNMRGLLGPQAVRVSGAAETEWASGKPSV